MSRTITQTGDINAILSACIKAGFVTKEARDEDGTLMGARLAFDGYLVGAVTADPVAGFGAATLTLSTGWCPLEPICEVIVALGR